MLNALSSSRRCFLELLGLIYDWSTINIIRRLSAHERFPDKFLTNAIEYFWMGAVMINFFCIIN